MTFLTDWMIDRFRLLGKLGRVPTVLEESFKTLMANQTHDIVLETSLKMAPMGDAMRKTAAYISFGCVSLLSC